MFNAFERAKDGETGLAYFRQIIAHPIDDEVQVAHVFDFVNAKEEARWPLCDVGTFWTKEEVPDALGDMWGPWVG